MHFTRSNMWVSALLSLPLSLAVVANPADNYRRQLAPEQQQVGEAGFFNIVRELFVGKRQVQEICIEDVYYSALVSDGSDGTAFCSSWISIGAATVEVDYTPTS